MTPFVTALVTRAWTEYRLWTKPDGTRYRETDAEMTGHLQRYYGGVKLGQLARTPTAIQERSVQHRLPTAAELQSPTWHANRNYWSAAFISYLFFAAGAGNQFWYALRHAEYVSDARNNLHHDPKAHPFQAYPLGAMAPAEGDVLVRRRAGSLKWADLPRDFSGHCDLVVDASSRSHVVVMGGNVGMPGSGNIGLTVNTRQYTRDAGGFLRPSAVPGGIALIKNFK